MTRTPGTMGAAWVAREIRKAERMDRQTRYARAVIDAVMDVTDCDPWDLETISNALDDAKSDLPAMLATRDAIQRSEAEA